MHWELNALRELSFFIFVRSDLGIVVTNGKTNEFSSSSLQGLKPQVCDKLIIRNLLT